MSRLMTPQRIESDSRAPEAKPESTWVQAAAGVCRRAAQGELDARILGIADGGDSAELLHSINHLLDMTEAFIRESTATLEAASRGEYQRPVRPEGLRGTFGQAVAKINAATQRMDQESRELKAAQRERQQLSDELSQTSELVDNLVRSSQHISEMSNLIETLAAQTNLLALNASIESARAGEAGLGFAVVAHEVKNLADKSAAATKQIKSLVKTIETASKQVDTSLHKINAVLR